MRFGTSDPEVEALITTLECIAEEPNRFSKSSISYVADRAMREIRKAHPLETGPPPTSCENQRSIYDLMGAL